MRISVFSGVDCIGYKTLINIEMMIALSSQIIDNDVISLVEHT